MHERAQEQRNHYFQELTRSLQQGGFTAGEEADGLLPVEWEGRRLCSVTDNGKICYWQEDITDADMHKALEQVVDIAKVTAEYMGLLETAPRLKVGSTDGDYRLLADYNGVVLAGHPTKYGIEFITWERGAEEDSLNHGHYYGPGSGRYGYTAARQDFAVRSGSGWAAP